jgi:hypothetical protein
MCYSTYATVHVEGAESRDGNGDIPVGDVQNV